MNETHKRLRVGRSMAQSGRGDRATDGGIGVSAKENVTPSNSVVVNPYRRLANAVRVEQASMVRNPYKLCVQGNRTKSLYRRGSPQTVRCVIYDQTGTLNHVLLMIHNIVMYILM